MWQWITSKEKPKNMLDISVSVAESVTAGALANTLCSDPGASGFFYGGIVAYSIISKEKLLGIDVKYAEKNNFANPFTTLEMAKAAVAKFESRIGIGITGYSLPMRRLATEDLCELDIKTPYAYITLYDSYKNIDITKKLEYVKYDELGNRAVQRASAQAFFALEGRKLYLSYVESITKELKPEN